MVLGGIEVSQALLDNHICDFLELSCSSREFNWKRLLQRVRCLLNQLKLAN